MARLDLDGAVVVLTGSTGGLGRALATALRARGARVALLDLEADALRAQAADLGGPEVAHGWVADVRDLAALTAAVDAAAAHFGGIDVVVAMAGVEDLASLAAGDAERFEAVVDINLVGVWRTFRAALPHVTARRGHLVAISSMAAFVHSPLQASYTASKAGVWAMADSIRLELRSDGVTVGTIHPTFFATPMMDRVHADPAGEALWRGNSGMLWGMVGLDAVIDGIIGAIERRSVIVTVPRRLALVARMPGMVRPFIDRFGFSRSGVARAVELSGER